MRTIEKYETDYERLETDGIQNNISGARFLIASKAYHGMAMEIGGNNAVVYMVDSKNVGQKILDMDYEGNTIVHLNPHEYGYQVQPTSAKQVYIASAVTPGQLSLMLPDTTPNGIALTSDEIEEQQLVIDVVQRKNVHGVSSAVYDLIPELNIVESMQPADMLTNFATALEELKQQVGIDGVQGLVSAFRNLKKIDGKIIRLVVQNETNKSFEFSEEGELIERSNEKEEQGE